MAEFMSILIAFVLLFGGGALLMRLLSGWGQLEKRFKCRDDLLNGQISRGSFRWVGSRFRFIQLVLAVEIYPTYLWLRPSFPLNLALKPICIPWKAIQETEVTRNILRSKATVGVEGCSFSIQIYGTPGLRIHAAAENEKAGGSIAHNSSLNSNAANQRRSA